MTSIEELGQIFGALLAIVGVIFIMLGILNLFSTDPNPWILIGGASSFTIGMAVFKASK